MAIAYAAGWYLAADGSGAPSLAMWDRWDGSILMRIARFGYTEAADPHSTAFFPGFPLLLKPFAGSATTVLYAALLINAIASVVAVRYLLLLGEEDAGEGSGRRAALYLLLFPTAVFLIAPYTEALFLAGAIPAFYFARRRRWVPAGLAAAVAMSARFAGVFLIAGLAVEWFRRRGDAARAALGALIAIVPLILYGAYLASSRGDFFYYVVDQKAGWKREPTNPLVALQRTWETWTVGDHPTNWRFAWRMEILAAMVGIAVVVWAVRKKEWGYAAFMGSLLATLLVSTWYFSIPRMLLTMFPITLFLAAWSRDRNPRHEALLVGSAVTCALGVIVFTQGAWFY
jgi:Gpi18-like mannosyltransferase